jgi:hypothetical protein
MDALRPLAHRDHGFHPIELIRCAANGADAIGTDVRCEDLLVSADNEHAGIVLSSTQQPIHPERKLHEFHGGARALNHSKYFTRRAEVWGLMADWLKAGAEIPADPELEVDLVGPQYDYSAQQQIQLEKKEDMKRRGLASPDMSDTLAMTFAVTVRIRDDDDPDSFWKQLARYRYRSPYPQSWMEF